MMKIKKALNISSFIIKMAIALILGWFIGKYLFDFYQAKSFLEIRVKAEAKNNQLTTARYNLSTNVDDYERSIITYTQKPNNNNKKKLIRQSLKLNKSMDEASKIFGLAIKRWVDLYNVWNYHFQKSLFTSPRKYKQLYRWNDAFLTYSYQVLTKADMAIKRFKLNAFSNMIEGNVGIENIDLTLKTKIEKQYNEKIKGLIPKYEKMFSRDAKKNYSNCLPPSLILNSVDSMAKNITFFQYASRYCPFTFSNEPKSNYSEIKNTFVTIGNKKYLQSMLILYGIAQKRLNHEAKRAKKYSSLPYNKYYATYIKPLIPKYHKQLKKIIENGSAYKKIAACSTRYIPVVSFRDPNIDARNAAYEIYSATLCHQYFEGDYSDFGSYQYIRYLEYKIKHDSTRNAKKRHH